MRKKWIAALLAACMLVVMLPTVTLAAATYDSWEAATAPGVTLEANDIVKIGDASYTYVSDIGSSGLDLSSSTPDSATIYKAGDGYVLFAPASGSTSATVTLNNATISGNTADDGNDKVNLTLPANVTVVVSGTNAINTGGTVSYYDGFLYLTGNTTIQGGGTLTVSNTIAEKPDAGVSFNLTIDGTTVTAGSVNNSNSGNTGNALTLTNGATLTVNAEGGYVSWLGQEGITVEDGCSLIANYKNAAEDWQKPYIFTNKLVMNGSAYIYSQGGVGGNSTFNSNGIQDYIPAGYTIGTNPDYTGNTDLYILDKTGKVAKPLELKQQSSTFTIYNLETLQKFAEMVKDNPATDGVVTKDFSMAAATSWEPMGTEEKPYTGTLDGGGHTITGLTASSADSGAVAGLFGYVGSEATIKDLTLSEVSVSASGKDGLAGALCGSNAGTITGCAVTGGTVSAYGQSGSSGSICGQNTGTITGCKNTAEIIASGQSGSSGGIAGQNSGTLTGCANTGWVRSSGQSSAAGGACGNNSGMVTDCTTDKTVRVSVETCEYSATLYR